MIDLRSDTVTRPTPAMREAMANAPVGDDVFNEDPTVQQLEQAVSDALGKEAALFVTSGTMSNQLGIRAHCQAGQELICDRQCHIQNYEQAAHTQFFGVAAQVVDSPRGVPTPEQFTAAIRPDDPHFPRTRLLCLENTHNRWGGRIASYDEAAAVCALAEEKGIARHLDGARLWNAAVAAELPWRKEILRWGALFDTVSVCFSKGLGAPVGSVLAGSADAIATARRTRKALGGGMRQVGVIAAAALHALEHHVDRLADDHRRAQQIVATVADTPGVAIVDGRCDTNLVLIEVDPAIGTAGEFAGRLADEDVAVLALGPQRVRIVTHLDVDDADIDRACEAIRAAAASTAAPTSVAAAY